MIKIKSVGLAFLMLVFIILSADSGSAKARQAPLSPAQTAVLERVNGYFNALIHLQGRFTQIGPNGEFSQGAFYIARPGKVRFEYEEPNPILIVSDGFWVGIEDRKLKTTDKYPLSATPLSLLLDERVNLREEATIIDAREEEGFLSITFEDNSGTSPGQLTLIFGSDDLMLRQWIVLDGQGLRTEVSLFDQLAGSPIDPKLFWIKDNAAMDLGDR